MKDNNDDQLGERAAEEHVREMESLSDREIAELRAKARKLEAYFKLEKAVKYMFSKGMIRIIDHHDRDALKNLKDALEEIQTLNET